ncbi:MAG TPA: hypothetical protein DCY93_01720 [Firmicutes bacterium]|nr:hypothetical protein [Bacillota bacterium]
MIYSLDMTQIGLIISGAVLLLCGAILLIMEMVRKNKEKKGLQKREEELVDLPDKIISACGGIENITEVECKMTRLVLHVKDSSIYNGEGLDIKALLMENKITLVIGNNASSVKEEIEKKLS